MQCKAVTMLRIACLMPVQLGRSPPMFCSDRTAPKLTRLLPQCIMQKIDTLVLLMGGSNLAAVVERLLEAGRPVETPVALVREAALATQREWRGSLGSIVGETKGEALSPCIIIVGEVSAM